MARKLKSSDSQNLEVEINNLNRTLQHLVKQRSLPYIFISGIMSAVGSLLGASLIFALIGFILSKLDFIPVVRFILENMPKR